MLKSIFRGILMALLLLAASTLFAQTMDAGDQAIHEQLRALLQNVQQAVNARQYDRLAQYFDPKMHVTPSNQEVLSSPDQIKPYFDKWFGPGRFLKSLDMTLKADALTELNAARDAGIVFGTGMEKYELSDGRRYDVPSRWTATVVKGDDGQWRIKTLHIGVDFTDNPLFNEVKAALPRFAIYGAAAGLLAGLLVGWLVTRRRRPQA